MRVAARPAVITPQRALPPTASSTAPRAARQLVTPLQPTAQPTAERLAQTWATQRLASAQTAELPRAIDALMAHHLANGFYGNRMDGMRPVHGVVGDSLEVRLAPNRVKVPINQNSTNTHCDLCDPPFPEERGLSWRGWRVWPNAFPYVPSEFQHVLLTTAAHRTQGYSPQILADMIDFQAAANGGRQLTMHFNGIAGHSQAHLHWQATRITLPLQRYLDEGRLPLRPLLRGPAGRIDTFDHVNFAGFLVSGETPFVTRQASRIIARLENDPTTRGAYNLLLLSRRAGRARLVIVPRRADNLKPVVGSLGKAGIGAFNSGGVMVIPKAEVPADFAASIGPAMRSTVVPPDEFGWLSELGREEQPALCPASLSVAA